MSAAQVPECQYLVLTTISIAAQLSVSKRNISNIPCSVYLKAIKLSALAAPSSLSSTSVLHVPARPGTESWRDALSAYIEDPTSTSHTSVVLHHNTNFVTIRDIWPKATVHLLVLPCSQAKTRLHPFTAFDDPAFLALVRAECVQAKKLAANELRSKFGEYSAMDKRPEGRDWAAGIKMGVHAVPTMSNVHIHVMSKELCGGKEPKHAERYNSFYSPFFVPLEDFPLAANDPRRWPELQEYIRRELECWKCKGKFGNDFENFKKHLDVELENFKRE